MEDHSHIAMLSVGKVKFHFCLRSVTLYLRPESPIRQMEADGTLLFPQVTGRRKGSNSPEGT
jgi:hypothetical protein